MSVQDIAAEDFAKLISAYAEATGQPVVRVTRDAFRAAHRHLPWTKVTQNRWTEAKSIAARGAISSVPAEVLPVGHRIKGVSTFVDADGQVKGQWVKTTENRETDEELIARLMAEMPQRVHARVGSIPAPPTAPDDLLAVYPLGDPHVGLLSWAPESGADFDLSICEDLMTAAMRDLVLRGPRTSEALIVNLGDFLHYDNADSRTTKSGHSLDTDSRAPKVLAVALRVMVSLIDAALEHHESVTVDTRIGNHDGHTSLMFSLALGAYYRNEPRCHVPPTVSHRAYYERGRVLIGTTHGDRAKPEALPGIMAAEQPEAWGRTEHRYWLTGHIHHLTRKEHAGCVIESFRTLAARDAWHSAQGYVSGRDMQRIVYDLRHGETSREVVSVGAILARAS